MRVNDEEPELPIPPDLDALLRDPALPLDRRTEYRYVYEEHVERLARRGERHRIPGYYRQATTELREEIAETKSQRRIEVMLKVVQRVVFPAVTCLGTLAMRHHGLG